MKKVSDFISSPTEAIDVKVSQVVSDQMFEDLLIKMKGIGWSQIDKGLFYLENKIKLRFNQSTNHVSYKVREKWNSEYKNRKIISEFIKDPIIGKKRLASMPDR